MLAECQETLREPANRNQHTCTVVEQVPKSNVHKIENQNQTIANVVLVIRRRSSSRMPPSLPLSSKAGRQTPIDRDLKVIGGSNRDYVPIICQRRTS